MVATPGTIPALPQYQPGALPLSGQEIIEIASSATATSATSGQMPLTDVVGKVPGILPVTNPSANDLFAFTQAATNLPKACTLANFGVPSGNVSSGGTTGQIYNKNSATNFDAGWSNITKFVAAGTTLGTSGAAATSITFNVVAGGISSTQLGAFAVVRGAINTSAVGSAQLDTGAVLRANLTAIAVGSAQIDVGAVLRTNIGALAVGSAQIDSGAVLRVNLGAQSVGSTQIDTGAVGSTQLGANAVLRTNMTAFAIGSGQLDTASVGLATTVVGQLGVPNGGTNTSILTQNGVLYGNGSSTIGITAAGGTGNVLLVNNGTPFVSPFLNTLGFARVTASNGQVSSTTLLAVGGLSVALPSTSTLFFRSYLYMTCGSTGGAKVSINFSQSVANIVYDAFSFSQGALTGQARATALTVAIVAATTLAANTTPTSEIRGTITTNSSGTLTVQIAQVAATTTTTLALAGSLLEVYQVT
ncbi:MAG: hypothetical protein WCD69_25445 [Xanthobacteraceae bacterium]